MDEYRRLLYVALTRPRDRLYVCGYDSKEKRPSEFLVRPCRARDGAAQRDGDRRGRGRDLALRRGDANAGGAAAYRRAGRGDVDAGLGAHGGAGRDAGEADRAVGRHAVARGGAGRAARCAGARSWARRASGARAVGVGAVGAMECDCARRRVIDPCRSRGGASCGGGGFEGAARSVAGASCSGRARMARCRCTAA